MEYKDIIRFLYTLYQDTSPMTISINCRKRLGIYNNSSFVYGDSHLPSLSAILNAVTPKAGEVFYDFGSGGGRLVLFAALAFPFARSIGIELLDDLVVTSQKKLVQCKEQLSAWSSDNPLGEVAFIQGDFLTMEVADANIVYIASTCFPPELMQALATLLAAQLTPGARVITFTKGLPGTDFHLTKVERYPMEWGKSTVYFHQKV